MRISVLGLTFFSHLKDKIFWMDQDWGMYRGRMKQDTSEGRSFIATGVSQV